MYEYSDQLGYRELMVIHRDKTEGMFEVSDDWSPGRDVTKSRIFFVVVRSTINGTQLGGGVQVQNKCQYLDDLVSGLILTSTPKKMIPTFSMRNHSSISKPTPVHLLLEKASNLTL